MYLFNNRIIIMNYCHLYPGMPSLLLLPTMPCTHIKPLPPLPSRRSPPHKRQAGR